MGTFPSHFAFLLCLCDDSLCFSAGELVQSVAILPLPWDALGERFITRRKWQIGKAHKWHWWVIPQMMQLKLAHQLQLNRMIDIWFVSTIRFCSDVDRENRLGYHSIIFIGLFDWKQRKKNVNRSTAAASLSSLRVRVTFRFWPNRYGLPRWLPISKCDLDT